MSIKPAHAGLEGSAGLKSTCQSEERSQASLPFVKCFVEVISQWQRLLQSWECNSSAEWQANKVNAMRLM